MSRTLFRKEQAAFADESKPRLDRNRLMRHDAAIGIVLALALACRYRQSKVSVFLDFSRQTERDGIQQRVCRAIVLKIGKRRRLINRL